MKAKVIFKTSRSITLELEEYGIFYTEKEYEIWLNGSFFQKSDRVIQTVYGLLPDTEYQIELKADGISLAILTASTEYEFVTLNVRKFGAAGDGVHGTSQHYRCHGLRPFASVLPIIFYSIGDSFPL